MKIARETHSLADSGFECLFPKNKDWFSPKEVAAMLGCSDQYIRNSIHSGKIMGHIAGKVLDRNLDNKSFIRIHKHAVLVYLFETANYTSDSFIEKISEIISRRSDFELMRLEKIIKNLLYSNTRKYL